MNMKVGYIANQIFLFQIEAKNFGMSVNHIWVVFLYGLFEVAIMINGCCVVRVKPHLGYSDFD